MDPRHLCRLLVLTASAVAAGAALPVPDSLAAQPPGAPESQVGADVSLALRRVGIQRSAALIFGTGDMALPGRREEQIRVNLEFDLVARRPNALERLAVESPGQFRITARDGRGAAVGKATGELECEEEEASLVVTLTGVSPGLRELAVLEGELRLYPRARRLRFHVPWLKDNLPQRVEVGGGTATLRRFQLVESDSTLWVAVRPPEGFRVAPLSRPGAVNANAVDIDGNFVNGGGIEDTVQTADGDEPEYRFYAPELRRTPSRLMLDVLCVAGEPQALPFRFRGIPLPAGNR